MIDNELDEEDVSIDDIILERIGNNEGFSGIPEDILSAGIRRLYLAGRIKKRKEGKTIVYSISEGKKIEVDNNEVLGNADDRHNVSLIARKLRSCRYHVERDISVDNGLLYSLVAEKKDKRYFLMYLTESPDISIFSKMIENDNAIRIVTPDNTTKLSVAKSFNEYVDDEYGEDGLIHFNERYALHILTMEQFFKGTTWKNLFK